MRLFLHETIFIFLSSKTVKNVCQQVKKDREGNQICGQCGFEKSGEQEEKEKM